MDHARVVADVALVSIVGGVRDRQVSSSMARVDGLAPPRAALTVGVEDVPGANDVSADHQSIAWCNQLVRVLADALLDVAEGNEGKKTPAEIAASRFETRVVGNSDDERRDNAVALDDERRDTLDPLSDSPRDGVGVRDTRAGETNRRETEA